MKLVLVDSKYFRDSISIISELVNEARFKITADAVELVAMDPANVAMVIFKALSSSFTEFEVKKATELAINMGNLKQILKRAKPNDILTIDMDDENKLRIQMKSNTTRTFSLPIIDLEEKEQKVPELNFGATVSTRSEILNEAIEDADIVAESVTFIAEKGKLNILAEGDLSKARLELADSEDTKIEAAEKVKAKYSIEYLKKMIGGSKLADKVTLSFNNDYPLKLEYKVVDKTVLGFILAPRVEND
ncbi:MAG: proliferating cell nuclear antigen (pcna) [archaeon]